MKYKVFNYEHSEIIEANEEWKAEHEFISRFYPRAFDDDLPDLFIEVEEVDEEGEEAMAKEEFERKI